MNKYILRYYERILGGTSGNNMLDRSTLMLFGYEHMADIRTKKHVYPLPAPSNRYFLVVKY